MPNARGLREAGFAPGHGPGYATLAEPGRDARGIAEGLASGELSTVWLNYADPVRYFPDRPLWEQALGTAQTVIAVESVLTETVREHADVVFPGEAYPEKEGTVTNLDGRVQRLRVAIGRPKGRSGMPGSGVRPVWQVISDLGDLGVVTRRRRLASSSSTPCRSTPGSRSTRSAAAASAGPSAITDWARLGAARRSTCRRCAAAGRRQAAARDVPQPVGGQGGRRLADPAVRDPAPGRRAVARGRRRRSACARATASRSAPTAPACAAR